MQKARAQQPGESGLHQHHARRRSRRVQLRQRPPPSPPKSKRERAKRSPCAWWPAWAAVAVCFGSGMAGAVVASRAGLTGSSVVLQTVERDTTASSQGSTGRHPAFHPGRGQAWSAPSVVVITTEQMVSSGISLVWRQLQLRAERRRFRRHHLAGRLYFDLRPCH